MYLTAATFSYDKFIKIITEIQCKTSFIYSYNVFEQILEIQAYVLLASRLILECEQEKNG